MLINAYYLIKKLMLCLLKYFIDLKIGDKKWIYC